MKTDYQKLTGVSLSQMEECWDNELFTAKQY